MKLRYIILMFFATIALKAEWTPLGAPEGGNIVQLEEKNGVIYAVAPFAGIYSSSDNGDNWSKMTDDSSFVSHPYEIALDDLGNLYCSTSDLRFYKYSIANKMWNEIKFQKQDKLQQFYVFQNVIYVVTDKNIILSNDQGNNWEILKNLNQLRSVNDLLWFNNFLYIGTNEGLIKYNLNDNSNQILGQRLVIYKLFANSDTLFAAQYDTLSKYFNTVGYHNDQSYEKKQFDKFFVYNFKSYQKNYVFSGINYNLNLQKYPVEINYYDDTKKYISNIYYNSNFFDVNRGLLINNKVILASKQLEGILKFNLIDLQNPIFSNEGLYTILTNSMVFDYDTLKASSQFLGISKSNNDGISWQTDKIPLIQSNNTTFINPINKILKRGDSIIVASKNGIYLSYVNLSNILQIGDEIVDFASDKDTIYAISNTSTFKLLIIKKDESIVTKNIPIGRLRRIIKDLNSFFIATDEGIVRVANLGNIISNVSTRDFTIDTIQSFQKIKNYLFVGTNKQLQIYNQLTDKWNIKLNGLSVLSLLAYENYIIAGTNKGCYLSLDLGENWIKADFGIKDKIFYGLYENKKQIYSVIPFDKIYKNNIKDLGRLNITGINSRAFCTGDKIELSYKANPEVIFNSNNKIIYELFDVNDYTKFILLKEIQTTEKEHTEVLTISDSIPFGTNYRIRVRATSDPTYISVDNLENITIIQSNNNKISGYKTVCQNEINYYSIPVMTGWNYSWSVIGGEVVSGGNLNLAQVKFTSAGNQKVLLRKQSDGSCYADDTLNVLVNPTPEKPVIIVVGDKLISSIKNNISWYRVPQDSIIGKSDTLFVTEKGSYYVVAKNESGCITQSDKIDFDPNSIWINLTNHTASPGEDFNLNFVVKKTKSFKELGISKIYGKLVFNATLLYPVNFDLGQVENSTAKRIINLTLDTNLDLNNSLKTIKLLSMLGNNSIDSVKFIIDTSLTKNTFSIPGIFNLNVCLDETGKPRILTKLKELQIVNITPNPISENAKIEFYSSDIQNVKITLIDNLGIKVKEIANSKYNSGENTVELDLNEFLPGSYRVMIESSFNKDTYGIIKVR